MKFYAQDNDYVKEVKAFQQKLNDQYKNPEDSPLIEKDMARFVEHDFFPINADFKVTAKLEFLDDSILYGMATSTSRIAKYNKYAIATFEIEGETYQLTLYTSETPSDDPEYADHVFLPFTDKTNGNSTYGGGRYIDLKTTEKDTIIIDFNKSYNPYCAYSPYYSCPKPPKENHLPIEINAGILKSGL
jgi:uncharacterized protein (DUF1684 family)